MKAEHKQMLDSLTELLERISKGAGSSEAVAGGAAATTVTDGEVVTKSPAQAKAEYVDPLRASFMELAEVHRGYQMLGTQQALDNPYAILRKKSDFVPGAYELNDGLLGGMICTLLEKGRGKAGIPLQEWAAGAGRQQAAILDGLETGLKQKAFGEATQAVSRALTTAAGGSAGGGLPLIRVDIEPLLREAYLREFPAIEQISTIPANGLVHSYNVRTDIPDAVTVAELGTLTAADGASTIERRANANIAIIAAKRGISLKLQYATAQSGMGFNLSGPSNIEVQGAMNSIARTNQALLLQGNQNTGSKTLDDEEGLTDANAYDGLRTLLKGSGTALNKGTDTYITVLNKAVAQLANAGGNVRNLMGFMSYGARIAVNAEFQDVLRILNAAQPGGFPTNLSAAGVVTVSDYLSRFLNVPAGAQKYGLGYYTYSAAATEDIDVLDTSAQAIAMAYLGSPTPVVLELPLGYDNTLANVYIVFLMNGLVLYIPTFHRKIRIPRQTV